MTKPKLKIWDNKNKCWYEPTHKHYKGKLFELFITTDGNFVAHTMKGVERLDDDRFEIREITIK